MAIIFLIQMWLGYNIGMQTQIMLELQANREGEDLSQMNFIHLLTQEAPWVTGDNIA